MAASCRGTPKILPGTFYSDIISKLTENYTKAEQKNPASAEHLRSNVKAEVKSNEAPLNSEQRLNSKRLDLDKLLGFDENHAHAIARELMKNFNLTPILIDITSKTDLKLEDITEDAVVKIMGKIAQEYLDLLNRELETFQARYLPLNLGNMAKNSKVPKGFHMIDDDKNLLLDVTDEGFKEVSLGSLNESEFIANRGQQPSSSTPKKETCKGLKRSVDCDLILSLSQFEHNEVFKHARSNVNYPVKTIGAIGQTEGSVESHPMNRALFYSNTQSCSSETPYDANGQVKPKFFAATMKIPSNINHCQENRFGRTQPVYLNYPEPVTPPVHFNHFNYNQNVLCHPSLVNDLHLWSSSKVNWNPSPVTNDVPSFGSTVLLRSNFPLELLSNLVQTTGDCQLPNDLIKESGNSIKPYMSIIRDDIYNSTNTNRSPISVDSSGRVTKSPHHNSLNSINNIDGYLRCPYKIRDTLTLRSEHSAYSDDSLNGKPEISCDSHPSIKFPANPGFSELDQSNVIYENALSKFSLCLDYMKYPSLCSEFMIGSKRTDLESCRNHATIPLCYEIENACDFQRLCTSTLSYQSNTRQMSLKKYRERRNGELSTTHCLSKSFETTYSDTYFGNVDSVSVLRNEDYTRGTEHLENVPSVSSDASINSKKLNIGTVRKNLQCCQNVPCVTKVSGDKHYKKLIMSDSKCQCRNGYGLKFVYPNRLKMVDNCKCIAAFSKKLVKDIYQTRNSCSKRPIKNLAVKSYSNLEKCKKFCQCISVHTKTSGNTRQILKTSDFPKTMGKLGKEETCYNSIMSNRKTLCFSSRQTVRSERKRDCSSKCCLISRSSIGSKLIENFDKTELSMDRNNFIAEDLTAFDKISYVVGNSSIVMFDISSTLKNEDSLLKAISMPKSPLAEHAVNPSIKRSKEVGNVKSLILAYECGQGTNLRKSSSEPEGKVKTLIAMFEEMNIR